MDNFHKEALLQCLTTMHMMEQYGIDIMSAHAVRVNNATVTDIIHGIMQMTDDRNKPGTVLSM